VQLLGRHVVFEALISREPSVPGENPNMTATRADVVLRHIRELAAAESTATLPDRQLLERFATARDEAAFETLVRRHGPLVLGVCRRVLHDRHDAEDAFQATFLALARRAGSVGRRAALGTWLYQVAYHAALKARRRSAVRRRHEDQAPPRQPTDSLAEVTGRELLVVLDEELQRMPEWLRVPLVLCYLDGRTRDEAARELGWSLGTLKRRLEQARADLSARMVDRGVSLAALLAAGVGGAAVSSALASGTTAAALLTAAGTDAALTAGVLPLMRGGLRGVAAGRRGLLGAALLVATLVAAGAGLLAYRAMAPAADAPQPAPEAPQPAADERPARPAAPALQEMTVRGGVRGPDGKPVTDAQVMVWCRQGLILSTGEWWASYRNEGLGRTRSDQDGQFRLTVPRAEADINVRIVRVVVTAPGYGLAWKALDPDATEAAAEVRLAPVQRVAGHIAGLQGEDAAGVTVHVTRIKRKADKGERDDDTVLRPADDAPLTATTDAKGVFVFAGFGPDLTLDLEILDPRYERTDLQVNTADKKACENVRILLGPGRFVEGRVTYQDTGKPVPHARLMLASPIIEAKTDADGRFKVPLHNPRENDTFGFISRDIGVTAYPPSGEPYLGAAQGVDFPKGVVRREVNLALARGALILGKVTEAGSGKPVAGARIACNAGYEQSVVSGPDGSFRAGVAPGGVRVLVSHPSGKYIPVILGSAGGTLEKPIGDPAYHHAVVDVEVKKDEPVKEVNVSLRRGVTVEGRLLGLNDKPIASAVMFVSHHRPRFENTMHPMLVRDGRFEVRGLDPEKSYRLMFLEHPSLPPPMITPESLQGFPQLYMKALLGPANKLGMSVEVSPRKVTEELTVKLAACGSAKVRFLDSAGKPLANYSPWLQLVVTPGPRIYQALEDRTLAAEVVSLTGRYGGQIASNPTDAQGYVTFEGLIPGATYRLKQTDQEPNNEVLKEFTTEAGKTAELTVKVK
jgi:RNA polymerase sigma factor (sigma-70 family)